MNWNKHIGDMQLFEIVLSLATVAVFFACSLRIIARAVRNDNQQKINQSKF
ncbi:MAG: hypothetical protein AB7U05_09160 [Mangrovibacterium sp.]